MVARGVCLGLLEEAILCSWVKLPWYYGFQEEKLTSILALVNNNFSINNILPNISQYRPSFEN